VSTGGTATALEKAGYAVTRVEELTSFPEMVSTSSLLATLN
jgi:phosphoribosylaminoimidazolecarboxamide formyltransferase/IMP cyclohydrolase